MEDTATVVAAPDTGPAATEQTEQPQSAAEFRQSIRDRANGVHSEPDTPAPLRNDLGQFAAPEGPATDATTGAPPPADLVRIPIPDDHPLRHRVGPSVEVPAHLADLVRWANNTPVRTREVQEAKSVAQQEREHRLRAEAASNAWQQQVFGIINDPTIAAKYAEIKAWDEGAAQQWLNGVLAEKYGQVQEAQQKVDEQILSEQVFAQVQDFSDQAWTQVCAELDPNIVHLPHFQQIYLRAFEQYDEAVEARLNRGDTRPPSIEEFNRQHLAHALLADPHVRQIVNGHLSAAERAREERIRRETERQFAEQEREKLQQVASRRSLNPTRALPSNAQTAQTVPVNAQPSAAQLRQRVKDRLSGRASA